MTRHPRELDENGAHMHCPRWCINAQGFLNCHGGSCFPDEGSVPVVSRCQHGDLPVVADLEEFLDPAMKVADVHPPGSDSIVVLAPGILAGAARDRHQTCLTWMIGTQVEVDAAAGCTSRWGVDTAAVSGSPAVPARTDVCMDGTHAANAHEHIS